MMFSFYETSYERNHVALYVHIQKQACRLFMLIYSRNHLQFMFRDFFFVWNAFNHFKFDRYDNEHVTSK